MNTPNIRFKGFSGDWEQRKLGSIGETYTGLSGKTKEDFGHGDARFVTYMNVFSNPVADKDVVEAVEIDYSQNEVQYGDVFFTTSSETPEEVGMSSVWLEHKENTYLNSFCFGYRPKTIINPYFMAYVLRSDEVRAKIIFLAQGISRYNISKNKVMEIEILFPDIKEQEKIGSYFSNLDNLITLHQRKCDNLKQVKKYMLQKMFPKQGEKVPEIRFAGFTGDWEQLKLEDISANYKYSIVDGPFGSDLKTIDYKDDGVLVMQSNYITGGKFEIKQPYFVSPDKAKKLSRCHCKGGDILIAKIGANFGICNIIPASIKNAVLSSNCMKVDLDENHDNNFYMQYLNTLYESGFYYSLIGITAQPALSLKFMKSLKVPSPSLEEQRKIASFLENIDNLITLHQRKSDNLKEIKKFMLQNMFPNK